MKIEAVSGLKAKEAREKTQNQGVPFYMQPGFIGNLLNGQMGHPQASGSTPSTSASAL